MPRSAVQMQCSSRTHETYKKLRQTIKGRQGITELMCHRERGVRLLAATDCIGWSPVEAQLVLQEIEAGYGVDAVSPRYMLKGYRAGRLDLEW